MQEPMPDLLLNAGPGTLAAAVRRRMKHLIAGRLQPYGLTLQQFWVILVLQEQGPSSLHPLAQKVWMDDPTASRVVKALVERGLLRTQPDPRHGRRILITLNPFAESLAKELAALAEEIRTGLVQDMAPAQLEALKEGLHAMIENIDAMIRRLPSGADGSDSAS